MKLESVPGLKQFCTFVVFSILLAVTIVGCIKLYQLISTKVNKPQSNIVSTVKNAVVVKRDVQKKKDGTIVIKQKLQPQTIIGTKDIGRTRVTFNITPEEIETVEAIKPIYKRNFYVGYYGSGALEGIGFTAGLLNGVELPWLSYVRLESGLFIGRERKTSDITGAWLLLMSKNINDDISIGLGSCYSVKHGNELTLGIRWVF